MGLYTVLKASLKGENTNITKNDLKFIFTYILLMLGISYIINFPGTHPTQTATVLIYLVVRDFRSENGMSSTEISPLRASLAAESAAEFPMMPTWPGT